MSEPTYLDDTRTAYDIVAVDYERVLRTALAASPFDRAVLAAFADLVRGVGGDDGPGGPPGGVGAVGPRGPVADLGCGPGRVTTHLASLGLDVFGVDLSPAMVEVARRVHPGLRFEVGSFSGLELGDATLAGIVAWYSIIHTPPESLTGVFAEFDRVLAPGGHLALAFQLGEECLRVTSAYGHEMSVNAYRLQPDRIVALARDCGFVEVARLVREPADDEPTPQAYLILRKPDENG